ncbi:MAG TPA: hypothetical protein VJ891_00175 [Casimicrobiaceae bacterium]|nr:hypothetical protein [Casimicrobiaceae bacterium]
MNRTIDVRVALAAAVAAGMLLSSGVALANRGGGDNGDSSMNPFTGDSYAYFHGGHNLGEQGTIRPDRAPLYPGARQDPKASAKASFGPAKAAQKDKNSAQQAPKRQTQLSQ